MSALPQPESTNASLGTRDDVGASDHDQPFRFGWRPRTSAPYPFNTRQYARLLLLRSRVHAGLLGQGDLAEGQPPALHGAAA
jgi:hypothetical protein